MAPRASAVPAGPAAARQWRAEVSRAPALQFVVGRGLEERRIQASLQQAKLAAWAGIERQQLGGGLAMAGPHAAVTRRDPGQQGRTLRSPGVCRTTALEGDTPPPKGRCPWRWLDRMTPTCWLAVTL